MKEHLLHYFPFLKQDFRKLEEKELQSEEVFKELFPGEPIELYKLKAIAVYQKAVNDIQVDVTETDKEVLFTVKVDSSKLPKKKDHGKV